MASFTTSLPLFISVGTRKKKDIYLNYNRVSNLHYQQRNQVKKLFTIKAVQQLWDCPKFDKQIKITYTVYKSTRRRYDVMNVVAVVDKFFQDALVEAKKIPDDNYTIVPDVRGIHGDIDKHKPRVDVMIEEIECGKE